MLMALLQWLLCNGFRFSLSLKFTSISTIFLDDGLYQKIPTRRQGPLSHWECSLSSTNLFIMATGQWPGNTCFHNSLSRWHVDLSRPAGLLESHLKFISQIIFFQLKMFPLVGDIYFFWLIFISWATVVLFISGKY